MRSPKRGRRSLRFQLAFLGMVAVLVPLIVLVSVVFAVESDSIIEQANEVNEVEVTTTTGVSPWIPLAAVLLTVPAAVLVWWWSDRAVRPVLAITDVANEIQAGSLDQRIGLDDAPGEVQALGDSFDAMLDRLATASTTQLQLIEDTSHELRTPLAALAVNNEVILNHPEPTLADYRESAERSEALIARLRHTIEAELSTARARRLETEQVDNDLMTIVRREVEAANALPDGARVEAIGPETVRLGIDGVGVGRAVRNLIENARHAAPASSIVEIEVTESAGTVRLSVSDAGPGIAAADQGRVFDRYFSTEEDGHGIGLAVVKQVADAHGDIELQSPIDDRGGSRFTMIFRRE